MTEAGQHNTQGSMEEQAKQLYRRLQMKGQARGEDEERVPSKRVYTPYYYTRRMQMSPHKYVIF